MRSVTDESKAVFDSLGLDFDNFALVSTEVGGIEADCIAALARDGEEITISPILIIVNEALFETLASPDKDLGENGS